MKRLFLITLVLVMILSGCAPRVEEQIVKETVIVEKVVKETVIVEKPVEKVVTATPVPEPIVLKFPSWQQDEPGTSGWWKELIAEFERTHPGVSIEFTKIGHEEYADTLLVQYAAGDPPEITHMPAVSIMQFADQGWLEPLDDWLQEIGFKADEWAGQDATVWEGETVAVMLFYFGGVMCYNERLLDEAGVQIPTNWEEFLSAAKALTKDVDGDGITDQFGVGFQTTPGPRQLTDVLNFVLGAGGNWTNQEGKVTIDTPECIEGLRQWKTVLTSGIAPLDVDYSKSRQLFLEERIAMVIDGPWIWAFAQSAPDDLRPYLKIAASPFHPPMGGESNVIAIPKDIPEEEKQLVKEFIQLLMQPEWQEQYAMAVGGPAPRKGSVTDKVRAALPFIDVCMEAMAEASAAGVTRRPIGLETHVDEFGKYLSEQTEAMIIQDRSPEEAAVELQRLAEEMQAGD